MAFKLFRKEKRLPTILGILIILVGIGVVTLLTQRAQLFFLKAQPSIIPQEVKISNLSSQSFTVSWITPDSPSTGYLKYGPSSSLGKVALDERDQKIDALGQYTLHYITVSGLNPKTTYYFVIVSQEKDYDDNGSPYSATTIAAGNKFQTLSPTYGVILEENGKTAREGIIYVKVGSSDLVSTLIKPSGNWLVPLDSLVDPKTKGPLQILPQDSEEIFVRGKQKSSKAVTNLDQNAPVPEITLGNDYDFRNTPVEETLKISASSPATPSFNLIQPASGSAIPGQPFFRGSGIPGKTVTIKVESPETLTGEAVIDGGGNWTWQPPKDLPSGKHTVTITSTDGEGNLLTIIRNFIILASGTQVTEAATPSATPTVTSVPTSTPTRTPTPTTVSPTRSPSPTSSPTPTVKTTPTLTPSPTPTPSPKPVPSLTLTPAPSATTSPLPEAGDLFLTLLLAVGGVTFSGLGVYFLRSKAA